MSIRSFKDQKIEEFFLKGRNSHKFGWVAVAKVVKRKLDMLNYARVRVQGGN